MGEDTEDRRRYVSESGTTIPVPDPTLLTTVQLNREVAALKEYFLTKLDGLEKTLGFNSDRIDRLPDEVDKRIAHVKEVHDGRFRRVEIQFEERELRAREAAQDNRDRIKAALDAAREMVALQTESASMAVAKSETAVAKQMDALSVQMHNSSKSINEKIDTNIASISDKIDEAKATIIRIGDRLTLIEGKSFGAVASDLGHQTSSSFIVALIIAAVAVAGFLIMIADKMK